MKIKIEYSYDDGFFAKTVINGEPYYGYSEKSYASAEKRLLEILKPPSEVTAPPPKEIEIEDV